MGVVYSTTPEENMYMANWMANILGESLEAFGFNRKGEPLFHCLGFSRNNELKCVVMLYMQTTSSVMCAFAATDPRWASKENIATWGSWIFGQMGKDRVTSMVLKGNKRSRKFVEGIGFKVEGKVRKSSQGEDMMIYGMLKKEHEAWITKAFKHGQR